jgi:lysophospholipase L1-like esterase
LKNCIRYLKKIAPQASLVFANTTPVPKGALRHNTGDARKYNSHASKVLRQYPEIQLNDLYSFVKTNPLRWKAPVDVHFNKEGYSALGIRVAQFILKALSVNRANSLYTFELTIYVKIPA